MADAGAGVTSMERATGIEPAFSAWEADVLPLNYTREVRRTLAKGLVSRCLALFGACDGSGRDTGVTFA